MSNNQSLLYKNVFLYSLAMRLLYRNYYTARYREVANLIPWGCTVVDVCSGDCYLYRKYLSPKCVRYIGLDNSPQFVKSAQILGVNCRLFDARTDELPFGDILIMQGSLYQFLPRPDAILKKIILAAQSKAIIAEPIKNMSSSNNTLFAVIAKYLTRPNGGEYVGARFNKEKLQNLFVMQDTFERSFLIAGGREMIGVFDTGR
jgi:hypothetical protein